jgi:hypothetical protein
LQRGGKYSDEPPLLKAHVSQTPTLYRAHMHEDLIDAEVPLPEGFSEVLSEP